MKKIDNNNLKEIEDCFDTGTRGHISNKISSIEWRGVSQSIKSVMAYLTPSRENAIYE